jgi:hypothetical protein
VRETDRKEQRNKNNFYGYFFSFCQGSKKSLKSHNKMMIDREEKASARHEKKTATEYES